MSFTMRDLMKDNDTLIHIEQILGGLDALNGRVNDLKDAQFDYEQKILDIKHKLEKMYYDGKGLNPVKHFVLLKKLQKYRVERRKVKLELRLLKDFNENKRNLLEWNSRKGMWGQIDWVLDQEFVFKLEGHESEEELTQW